MADEPLIAVFVDYENLAIGVRQMRKGRFQIELVLRRLLPLANPVPSTRAGLRRLKKSFTAPPNLKRRA